MLTIYFLHSVAGYNTKFGSDVFRTNGRPYKGFGRNPTIAFILLQATKISITLIGRRLL